MVDVTNLQRQVIHGTKDPMISVDLARESRDALAKLGVPASYREYEMGHEISPDALRQLISWLDEKVMKVKLLREDVPAQLRDKADAAVRYCPTNALKILED